MDDSRKTFDGIPESNFVARGTLINGYIKLSMEIKSFGLFRQMRKLGFLSVYLCFKNFWDF